MKPRAKMTLKEKIKVNEAVTKYVKTHLRRFEVRLNIEKEASMINYVLSKGNTQQYLKELIKKDMEGQQ